MMSGNSRTWFTFALCLAILLSAMGWSSYHMLRLDHAQRQAAQRADWEEQARLALWRMDSRLAPLLVEESGRPHNSYQSFYAADRAYSKSFTSLKQGDVQVPSPLLNLASSNILLHFQWDPAGQLTSPQVPMGNQRDLAENEYTTHENIEAAARRLEDLRRTLQQPASSSLVAASLPRSSTLAQSKPPRAADNNIDVLIQQTTVAPTNPEPNLDWQAQLQQGQIAAANAPFQALQQNEQVQQLRNYQEFNARQQVRQNVKGQPAYANRFANEQAQPPPVSVQEGPFKALWLNQTLVLARRVELGSQFVIQGCWLNWPNIKQGLLEGTRDLFATADLQPVAATNGVREPRMLAALPVKFVPGQVRYAPLPVWSPISLSLSVAWASVLLTAMAVGLLVHGVLALSERRAAFVSAVTHELRTPLTTFKMYSEMLAEGMVSDRDKQTHYLKTLCLESNRLSHLVENVLAYARLERGSARSRVERISLGDLLARVKPRLAQRAEQAGLQLVVDADDTAMGAVVHVDVAAVEQILFNLTDNACKYAAPAAAEKILHLEALPENGQFAMLRVRDHGQGISPEGLKRLFQPFSKSAHEAAHTAPGVGLGLALCRRLSRSMGGDLQLDRLVKDGAGFVLSLPLSRAGALAPQPASIA